MIKLPIYFKACTMVGSIWLLSFPCLGSQSYPRSLDGDQTSCFMESLVTYTCTMNEQRTYSFTLSSAWGVVHYVKHCMPHFTLTAAMFISFTLFTRVGVLPPILFTLRLGNVDLFVGICIDLVMPQSMAGYMMGPSLAFIFLTIRISKIKRSLHLLVDSWLLLLEA